MSLEIEAQFQLHHQQQQQLQHRLPVSACDRHPDQPVTGFCASCLRERLAGLESSAPAPRRNSTSSYTFKSIFKPSSELRRCKSFSASRAAASAAPFEPQRHSCDVRGRNTLWALFNQDDHSRAPLASSSSAAAAAEIEPQAAPEIVADEIQPAEPVLVLETSGEINGEEEIADLKPMKDHIDLDLKKPPPPPPPKDHRKEIGGSFWLAASVFSKKLQKWRRKQKSKKRRDDKIDPALIRSDKPRMSRSFSRRFRDTQSEIAGGDAFGRRSCDTDPRFSLDAGRISFDDPRYSWDEPRASWDGYLIGSSSLRPGSAFPRLPPMLSVVEDSPAVVPRSDGQIPVEEDNSATTPGGSAQTRDYYSDSSSRHRRSLDRSGSVRRDETKPVVSNAKVSPAVAGEFFHFRDPRDWSSNSLRDDRSESFESAYRDPHKLPPKKSRRWSKAWNIWAFIHRRGSSRAGANVVDRSFSESWPELRTNGYNARIMRSNSSVSSRSSFSGNGGGFGSMRRGNAEGKKRREEFVLERNRSARYSPGHVDNGMLRFYLTPMRSGSSRRKGGAGKNGHSNGYQSFTRSVLRMY